jgi:hypothetical protein
MGGSAGRAGALGGGSPALSITLTDHRARVGADMLVRYVAALTNDGSQTVRATLQVEPPRQATVVARRRSGTWHVKIRPGHRVRRHVTVRIGSLGRHAERVTAKARVYLQRKHGAPLIRTFDADRVEPASVAAVGPISRSVPRARPVLAAASPRWGTEDRLYVGIPAAVLAGLVLLLAAFARRRAEPKAKPRLPLVVSRSGGGRLAK